MKRDRSHPQKVTANGPGLTRRTYEPRPGERPKRISGAQGLGKERGKKKKTDQKKVNPSVRDLSPTKEKRIPQSDLCQLKSAVFKNTHLNQYSHLAKDVGKMWIKEENNHLVLHFLEVRLESERKQKERATETRKEVKLIEG